MERSPSAGRSDEIRRIFDEAVSLPPDQRARYVKAACRGRPDLERELTSLLRHAEEAPSFLDQFGSVARAVHRAFDSTAESAPDPMIGRTIAQYEIIEQVGGGGMGVVYKARDTKLARTVALKFLPPAISGDAEAKRRFMREAKAGSAVEHPNICTVFELSETPEGQLFIAMTFVEGETLKEKIARGPLKVDEAVSYAVQAARGLERAHRNGVVHRDVKPANIVVDEEGAVRLLDFGLAKLAGGSQITREGRTAGTAPYMSPEQVRGGVVDHRTDIWSLGTVLYEMITGKRAFTGEYDHAILYSILNVDPAPLQPFCDSTDVIEAVEKALEKDPARRHPDMRTFRLALEEARIGRPARTEESILVLPFEDISPNRDNDYFSEGISEDLISGLSQIRSLRVICRTSARHAKASGKNLETLRRELNVRYILEGSVRKAGNRIRITPQLIDAATQATLWSDRFDGTLDDIFDMQDRVARATIASLRLKLSDDESRRLAQRPISDVRAFECFLRAREEILQFTEHSLGRALKHLQNGLQIVGDNPVLWAGIGYVHWTYANMGIDREKHLEEAHAFADRVLKKDRRSGPGLRLLGLIAALEGNQMTAVKMLKKACDADPTDLESVQWLRILYGFVGKTEEAWPLAEREILMDPLNPVSQGAEGWLHFMEGAFHLADASYRKMYEMDPGNPAFIYIYAQNLACVGKREEACAVVEPLLRSMPDHPYAWLCRCLMHALRGEREKMSAALTPELEAMAREDLSHAWFMAECFALVDEKERAIDWLEIAVGLGFINHPFLSELDPLLEPIRQEERFQDLMSTVQEQWRRF